MELEKQKYLKTWGLDAYRNYAPGEHLVYDFMGVVKPRAGAEILDLGTGTGRAALRLHNLGYQVIPVDIAENCLDPQVRDELAGKLVIQYLWDDLPTCKQINKLELDNYGFCTDVMEHIPPEKVDDTLANFARHIRHLFFQICFRKDHFGEEVGEDLHLTVRSFKWWLNKLSLYGEVLHARDLINNGLFYVRT